MSIVDNLQRTVAPRVDAPLLAQVSDVAQDAPSLAALSVPDNVLRIPLECILLPRNVPAGLSPWILFAIANELRNTGADVRDPILVTPLGPDLWRLRDGRHRYVASVMAGVRDILAREVPNGWTTCATGC